MNIPNMLRWLAERIEAGEIHVDVKLTGQHASAHRLRSGEPPFGPAVPGDARILVDARWLGVLPDESVFDVPAEKKG